jgi:membrane protein DedA with SNARE-associated domain
MIYTILGSIVWNGVHVFLGWVLGENWEVVKQYATIIEFAVLAAIAVVIVLFVWRRWRAHRRAGDDDST